MQKKKVIELKEVSRYYKVGDSVVKAIDNISLTIEEGKFVVIMGPSGSGKSTSMNLIGSLDIPSHGKIFLDGHDISHLSESNLAQLRGKNIGFIFQQFNLIPTLTVKENIMLPMSLQGTSQFEKEKRVNELLTKLNLLKREDHFPNQISGGEQQRVAIARALANNPQVILADEPTGNLDTTNGHIVMNMLQEQNKEGKTIVVVTHEQSLAKEYADIIYWLKDGKIEKITKK